MEYYCHLCRDWLDSAYCQSHFESIHGSQDMTFEALKKRMDIMGGLMTREEPTPTTEPTEPKRRNWLFADKNDQDGNTFITNNFQHSKR